MKKLIALDMDGTLLTDAKTISPENKQAIKDAQAAGHTVMICSGRPHVSLKAFLEEAGFGDLPISASNGTITIVDEKVINQVTMDKVVAEKVFAWLISNEFPFNLYTNQGVFCHSMFFDWAWQAAKLRPDFEERKSEFERIEDYFKKTAETYFDKWEELPTDLGIFKFFVLTSLPTRKVMLQNFAQTVTQITYTSSFTDNVEISDVNGHKGAGITAVANHFGIPIENAIAMGDNFNDLGMLKVAGLSVAMGNAEPEIKATADFVTLTNDEHGVAHAIQKYVLK